MRLPLWNLIRRREMTEDDYQMSRRTVFTLLAWSPIIATGIIGLQTRFSTPDWDFPTATPEQEKAVYSYAPLVMEAQGVLNGSQVERSELLPVALRWMEGVENGTLEPLTPAFFEDRGDLGVKAEIFETQQDLIAHLLSLAENEEGLTLQQRVNDTLLAIRIGESLKYSDFRSLYLVNQEHARAIKVLQGLVEQMGDEQRQKVAAELEKIRIDGSKVEEMTRIARQQYAESKIRRGLQPLNIEEVQLAHSITNRLIANETGQELRTLTGLYAATNVPEYVTQLGIAWASCRSHNERLDEVIGQLQPKES